MRDCIFTFALHTDEDVVDGSIFDMSGEVKLWGIEKYYVTSSSTAYYRD